MFVCNAGYAQEDKQFFAQGLFLIENKEHLLELESKIRQKPEIYLVRMDPYSQRFLILTQDISSLSEVTLKSWFGEYAETLKCLQIGEKGVDVMNSFPFKCD